MRSAIIILFVSSMLPCTAQEWEVFGNDTTFFYRTLTASTEYVYRLIPTVPDGKYTVYFDKKVTSDTIVSAKFSRYKGDYVGSYRTWDQEGNLVSESTRDSLGRLHGPYLRPRYDGTKKHVGTYVNACKHGEWLSYDKEGNVYAKNVYDMGCLEIREYWKYEILLKNETRKQIQKMNELNRENRFIRNGKPKLMSYEKTIYSSCVIRERSLFDPKGRLLETVTFH